MPVWRPDKHIRVKVLGLAWRGEELLAAEIERDDGTVKGVRPLGGAIEFGETREQALHREFQEELQTDIRILGAWQAIENLYEYEGMTGHEIIFAAPIELLERSLYEREEIRFMDGVAAVARWFNPVQLSASGLALYPNGLIGALEP